jgi:ubiquinone/menaquinone biosynthesis C-methylase UbiE
MSKPCHNDRRNHALNLGVEMDIRSHNRRAWDGWVDKHSEYTIPVGHEQITAARRGDWYIRLTPTKPVPHKWMPNLAGAHVLCLASGGGQQGPVLAAAGAIVTVLDNSPRQLEQDRYVAEREGLSVRTVEGDMRDLSMFSDVSFDYVVHPVSNTFVPDVRPVWSESYRVLRKGGVLVAGFGNPAAYLFDYGETERTGKLEVKFVLPYSDVDVLSREQKARYEAEAIPYEFSHTLEQLIGGQLDAGFALIGFYEDYERETDANPLKKYMPLYIATCSRKG